MITEEDVDFLIHILTSVDPSYPVAKGVEVAERLKAFKQLWEVRPDFDQVMREIAGIEEL